MRNNRRRKAAGMVVAALCIGLSFSGSRAQEADDLYINFTFDYVDIATFAKLVGTQTGRRFAVADDVDGSITVVSPRVRREEAYPLFVSILESAGCSVFCRGASGYPFSSSRVRMT